MTALGMTADIEGWWEMVLYALAWIGIGLMCAWITWRPETALWDIRDLRDLWRMTRDRF